MFRPDRGHRGYRHGKGRYARRRPGVGSLIRRVVTAVIIGRIIRGFLRGRQHNYYD